MATVADLLKSMNEALERSREAQSAAVEAMTSAASRVKATGVKVSVESSSQGVQMRFVENTRSRAQVRFNPGEVASKAAERLSQAGQDAMRQAVSR